MIPLALAVVTQNDQPMLLYLVAGGLVAVSLFIANILTSAQAWASLRRNNSDCVSRTELREVHARVDAITMAVATEVGKMRGELVRLVKDGQEESDKHRRGVTEQLNGIERSVGRIEGMERVVEEHGDRLRDIERNRG